MLYPLDARNVQAAGESGMDGLVLLRFDTSPQGALDVAKAIVGGEPQEGYDPELGYLGTGLSWWPTRIPPGSAGRETRTNTKRTIKLLSVPSSGGLRTVYVAAFSS